MNQNESSNDANIVRDASLQGPEAVSEILDQHRAKLRRMVSFRMDGRIQQRVDPSDVVQEAYLEAVSRLTEYLENPEVPFFIWLRFITHQKMLQIQQRHLGVQARDPRREFSLQRKYTNATSAAIASRLVGRDDSPSMAAVKAEMRVRLREALSDMDEIDREVLALRHFEQLPNQEVASILDLSERAASKRYFRALSRLKKLMPDS